jgi:hypothetical protein
LFFEKEKGDGPPGRACTAPFEKVAQAGPANSIAQRHGVRHALTAALPRAIIVANEKYFYHILYIPS